MWQCADCGAVFHEDDAEYGRDCVGEFWGSSAYRTCLLCPECGSEDIGEFEYPYEECLSYKDCDYECDDCPFRKELENRDQEDGDDE